MKTVKVKEKKVLHRVALKESKIKSVVTALSKMKGSFSRKKIKELGIDVYSECLVKHFFLKNEEYGSWSFSNKKIEARGYKNITELAKNEGFFRSDLIYLFRTKNKKPKNIKKIIVSEKDKVISDNLFNLTYSK
jgi:hypothetical protein